MNRTRLVLSTVVALVAATLAVPGSARAADDPPGTIVLASGPSVEPRVVQVQAVTPKAVVYQDQSGAIVLRRRATGASTTLSSGGYAFGAGPLVLYRDYGPQPGHWLNTATGATGEAPTTWRGVAPTGGLILTRVDALTMSLSVQVATTGAVRTLTTFAYSGPDDAVKVAGGPNGAAVWWYPQFGSSGAPGLIYVPYSGGAGKTYDLTGTSSASSYFSCAAPSTTAIGCVGSQQVFAAPLSGTTVTTLGSAPGVYGVVVSSTAVAWAQYVPADNGGSDQLVSSVPVVGGAVTAAATPLTRGSRSVVSDGSLLYAEYGSGADTAAITSFPDAAAAPTPVAKVGASDYGARTIALAPGGRAGFVDNRRVDGAGWQTQLSATAGGVTAGAETLVVPGATGNGVYLSGARSGWAVLDGGHRDFSVTSPLQPTANVRILSGLSGTRAVTVDFASEDYRTVVLDLNTSAMTDVASFGATGYGDEIWGDSFYFTHDDGSVWRKILSSTAAATRVLGPSSTTYLSGIDAWGDHVVVVRYDRTTYAVSSTVIDLTTRAQTALAFGVADVSAAGYSTGSTLYSWDGSRSVTVSGSSLTSTSSLMAWVGSDGRPRAAPVPWTTPDAPRSLGNPLAPATVASGGTWSFDLPTSAPLTACTVDVLRGATVVRTLECDTAYTGGGDAVVQWDTKTARGRPAATGAYKWRVNASNADGPLQLATGATGTVSGTFTLTAAA